MDDISPLGKKAIEQARRGEFDDALATAKEALAASPRDKGLRFFAALLHSRLGELEPAAAELRQALALAPDDAMVRAELIRVLAALGRTTEAQALLDLPGLPRPEAMRLEALILARSGRHRDAADLYRKIVAGDPRDFESLGKLGVSLLASGDAAAAVEALEQALRLRPDHGQFVDKWIDANVAAGSAETALNRLYERQPADAQSMVTAARLEDLLDRPQKAVESLDRALAVDPANERALAALADLHERANRVAEFEAALARLEKAAPKSEKLPLLKARAAYRRGDFTRALELARQAPRDVDPAARAQLLGQANDRLGEAEAAFPAFEEMNAIDSLSVEDPTGKSARYLAGLEERIKTLTPHWVARWHDAPAQTQRLPAFLLGFPRSGTTLLDTLLMNHPDVAVSEENPMLTAVSRQIGAFDRIADLEPEEVEKLRTFYFDQAQFYVPAARERLLIDKFPFALAAGPLIHRLFPDAPILFLARHPCDVVLSCFMTRFQPTDIGSAFLTLEGTARLYDSMMRMWVKSRELLPLRVLDLRYETMVESPQSELRAVAEFLRIDWSDSLLDNRAAAQRRGFIKTPSYAQVSEPIYKRSVERWRKYERALQPALPILDPWIKALGYEA